MRREACHDKSCDAHRELIARWKAGASSQTSLQRRHKQRKGDQQEIQVKEKLGLLVQHDWWERERVVFLVCDGVWTE